MTRAAGLTRWGELVRSIRDEKRIPQRRLAEQLGVNRSSLRRVEAGLTYDIRIIELILRYLGYELEALIIENAQASRARKEEPVADIVVTPDS